MKLTLWSTYSFDDEEWMFDEIPIYFVCPFCQRPQVDACTPEDSYGDPYIVCNMCGFMGILNYEASDLHLGITRLTDDFQANHCYLAELAEFTHYNEMNDHKVGSEEFKLLEKQWLEGNTVWKEFQPHRFYFDTQECFNQTYLVTGESGIKGEFHFGAD